MQLIRKAIILVPLVTLPLSYSVTKKKRQKKASNKRFNFDMIHHTHDLSISISSKTVILENPIRLSRLENSASSDLTGKSAKYRMVIN